MKPKNRVAERADYLMSVMLRLGKNLHGRIHTRLSMKPDLTQGQMTVLFYLVENGPTSMRELARVGQVTMPTMTEIVARMVRLHLVERQPDSADRRVIRVKVLPKGREAFKAKHRDARLVFELMLASLNEPDQAEFIRAFQLIERILLKTKESSTA